MLYSTTDREFAFYFKRKYKLHVCLFTADSCYYEAQFSSEEGKSDDLTCCLLGVLGYRIYSRAQGSRGRICHG